MSYTRRSFISILTVCLALLGCTSGQASRYPYYTGIKNPRLIVHDTDEDVSADSPRTGQVVEDQSSQQTNRHGYPLPNITRQGGNYYRVKRGDTLYSIAWEYGYDVRQIAAWNRLSPPYTIYPRQQIRIKPAVQKTTKPRVNSVHKSPTGKSAKSSKKWTPKRTKTHTKHLKISWQWPTKGKIIGRYSARDSGKKGLDIAGKKGQPVYSAAGGEIVYSGSGLRGYGKLIIIKHNETFFSAYAHNHRLFVKEQQTVKKGQHIADMGSSEANRAMLHFEVRRNGKPVDPLRYLPRR